jgi:3-methyladenine DNA glycosylase Tag
MSKSPIKTDADALRTLTRAMFGHSFGFTTLDRRWPAFEAAFHGFDPKKVAELDPNELLKVPDLTKNRAKLHAVVCNAKAFVRLSEVYETFSNIIDALACEPYERREDFMRCTFFHVGPATARDFLDAAEIGKLHAP